MYRQNTKKKKQFKTYKKSFKEHQKEEEEKNPYIYC